ncbi:MAG: hypothetical protein HFP81_06105 [Methylococcales symbiont of Hymedesmia sp. n. MRB-2018]|nr:MAG: hypothetical protein HFP78_05135 [Methylococcales symbiont of Hymedesmia sp. n. MRB-2018]KAF3983685.1 MAG: hypothetical protein HFP81_06105 [Methylococcales symbiont of Hymedesmia sp. n. MRB-2018]
MKACEQCAADRIEIGTNHKQMSILSRTIGLILVYLPIFTLPFVIASAYSTYYSMIFCGAKNLKKWGDFIPDRDSHRYSLKNQIKMDGSFKLSFAQSKLYWIANCTLYCPYSVALMEWHAYLVKAVENWWCPFTHANKENYKNASIDQSFWHIYPDEISKLHEEDKANPIFTDEHDKDLKAD